MSEHRLEVSVLDGKYTIILPQDGGLHALRYGEKWRDLCGDGMVLALAQRIEELEETLLEIKDDLLAAKKGVEEAESKRFPKATK